MLKVLIRVPGNAKKGGKKLSNHILHYCEEEGILGAIILQGSAAYGERAYRASILRGMIELPQIIEIIDDPVVIQQIVPKLKGMVEDYGLMTIEEVYVI